MSITHLLNETVTIERKQETSTDIFAYTTTATIKAHIQPNTEGKRTLEEGTEAKRWTAYVEGSANVKEEDKIIDSNNKKYTVVAEGTTRRNFGSIDYKKVIIEETD